MRVHLTARRYPLWGLVGLALAVAVACSAPPGSGPAEVSWGDDRCARCRMVLTDAHYAAQVRGGPQGEPAEVYFFDDIGCAVIWLEDRPWKDGAATELWVTDHRSGHWIDARKAYYLDGQRTPMAYGLGAQVGPAEGALDFAQARARILEIESLYGIHSGHGHGESGGE